ncbi:hypothetical protein [Actinomadura chokoriensis]|uniref:hypothetical protein n=1 Tax=Actinomadura chokoriensis TaxID=454156 RepID=UPI0031F8EBF8
MIMRAVGEGLLAGLAGTAAMTAVEKLEQRLTGRPDSYVPARTLERVAGMAERESAPLNLAMHVGQGAALGVLHKAVYAFATGLAADALAARAGLGPGQRHEWRTLGREGG